MRIAQVAPLYESVPPRLYGGTELVVSYLTEELVKQGHDVTLFASGDSLTEATLVAGSPRSLRLDADCIDPLAHHILLVEKVLRYHEEDPFDVIHFHVDYLHFPISRREALPSMTTLHGRLDIPDLVPLYREFREEPVVSISDAQRNPLPWLNWIGTVHHGLPQGHYRAYTEPGKYLAFLGRISPEKGLDHAIQIGQQSGMTLKIAAKIDRADRDYFENKIKSLITGPNVEFLGEIGYPEKCDFLGNAAALLVPIQWPEPFGLVMIEAMACGTPIIAYPNGSVPEIVQNGINGYAVQNIQAAVKAVSNIPSLNRAQCRRYFEKHFTAARMCRDYLAIYEHLQTEPAALLLSDGAQKWTKPA